MHGYKEYVCMLENTGVLSKVTTQQNFYYVNSYATVKICIVNDKWLAIGG